MRETINKLNIHSFGIFVVKEFSRNSTIATDLFCINIFLLFLRTFFQS